METSEKAVIFPANEMSKNDLIETILMIIYKILDYTSLSEERTHSIFDQNYFKQELDSDKLSTSSSSNDEISDIYNSKKEENYTLHDYFYFWTKTLEFNEYLLLLTMMNIDKLLSKDFILTFDNIKNTLFTCMIITQKNYEDNNFNDKDYAKILEVSTEEIINMELKFLEYIDFSLYISDKDFDKYKETICKIWKDNLSFLRF